MKPLPISIAVGAAVTAFAAFSCAGAASGVEGVSVGRSAVPDGASVKHAVAATGAVVRGRLRTPDGRVRTYRLYVPRSLPARKRVPLLVALHGRGGSAKGFEQHSGFDALAEANKFLVAYPDGTWSSDEPVGRVWNAGGCCGSAQDALDNVNDVGFVSKLINKLKSEYNINKKRVFVSGHSNGAMMGLRLACQLSGKIVAVAVQSGTVFVDPCAPPHPVAVLEIHGTADKFVPIDGGVGPMDPAPVDFPPPEQGLEALAAADGCPSDSATSTDPDNPDLTHVVWQPCSGGTVVERIKVDGWGHAWMGAESPSGFDSSAAAWSFLSAYPRA